MTIIDNFWSFSFHIETGTSSKYPININNYNFKFQNIRLNDKLNDFILKN